MAAILKPIVEHFVIDLIHNVKILLNETIKAMAHTKQFKRFVEKIFILSANISLEVSLKEINNILKPKIKGSDSEKFGNFLKGVKNKIAASAGETALGMAAKNPGLLKTAFSGNSDDMANRIVKSLSDPNLVANAAGVATKFAQSNPNLARSMLETGQATTKGLVKASNFLKPTAGGALQYEQSGGDWFGSSKKEEPAPEPAPEPSSEPEPEHVPIETATKYVIEPRIFPTLPDITPENIKKFFYTPIEPFLQVITCKNCNNGMFVRIKNKIICHLMRLVSTMITILFKTGIFNSTVVFGSFKKALNQLAANPANLTPGGKLSQLAAVFEEQLIKNETRLKEIEEEEKSEFENATGMEGHEKLLQKKIEERNKTIDEISTTLEQAVREIKEDEFLPGKDRKPEEVRGKLSALLGDIDAKGATIQSTIKNEIPPEYATKVEAAKKNEALKKRANQILRDLRTLKSLPYYDETAEYKDPTMDPAPRIAKLVRELAEIKAELGGPAVEKQKRSMISRAKNLASGVKNAVKSAASGAKNMAVSAASGAKNFTKRMLGYKGGRRTLRRMRAIEN